jgi:hypothetical protein
MKKNNKNLGLICSAVLSVIFLSTNSPADEIGIATGLNTSVYIYKSPATSISEYQKTDILNPIEISFQKDFTKFFGIHSALQYSKPSVLSFVSGIGLGYIIKDRFRIGVRSSISRTLTDIYKNQNPDADIFFLNFYNVIYFSYLL